MKKNIVLFLKGVLIGIGKIIPGVSGSMIAINLNVYDKSINHIMHLDYEGIKFLSVLGLGILFSIVFMSRWILLILGMFHAVVMFLFIGFISGGCISLISDFDFKKDYFYFIIPLLLLLLLNYFSFSTQLPMNSFFYTFIGGIEALTMIVPGISGTAVMMMLGYYDKILLSFSSFDISFLFFFFLGLGVVLLLLMRLIQSVYDNHKNIFSSVVFGFSIGSIVLLLTQSFDYIFSVSSFCWCIVLFMIGFFIPLLLEKIRV